jgi:hypothetical protein
MHTNKGSIIIAMMFAIVLTITAASFFMMLGGRATFTTNQLKRVQAINYAEVALFETFNRFRVFEHSGGTDPDGWDRSRDFTDTITIPMSATSTIDVTVEYTVADGKAVASVTYADIDLSL